MVLTFDCFGLGFLATDFFCCFGFALLCFFVCFGLLFLSPDFFCCFGFAAAFFFVGGFAVDCVFFPFEFFVFGDCSTPVPTSDHV